LRYAASQPSAKRNAAISSVILDFVEYFKIRLTSPFKKKRVEIY